MAVRRMSMLTHGNNNAVLSPRAQALAKDINRYMTETEQEQIDEDKSLVHHHGADDDSGSNSDRERDTANEKASDIPPSPLTKQFSETKLDG